MLQPVLPPQQYLGLGQFLPVDWLGYKSVQVVLVWEIKEIKKKKEKIVWPKISYEAIAGILKVEWVIHEAGAQSACPCTSWFW